MFGIGMPEMILILAVALIVIGPRKLPELAKSLGRAMGEFKKATRDLKDSFEVDSEIKEIKGAFDRAREESAETPSATGRPAEGGDPETGDAPKTSDAAPERMTYEDIQAELNKKE